MLLDGFSKQVVLGYLGSVFAIAECSTDCAILNTDMIDSDKIKNMFCVGINYFCAKMCWIYSFKVQTTLSEKKYTNYTFSLPLGQYH